MEAGKFWKKIYLGVKFQKITEKTIFWKMTDIRMINQQKKFPKKVRWDHIPIFPRLSLIFENFL